MKLFRHKQFELQYSSWGKPSGHPAIFFHGFPGSHVQAEAIAPLVKKYDLYLIACDRPGYGGSRGAGTELEFLQAVRALLSSLKIEKFDVLGVSGGAPWAHLMASAFAEDTVMLAIICGLCPYSRQTKKLFSRFQWNGLLATKIVPQPLTRKLLQFTIAKINPQTGLNRLAKLLNTADQAILSDPANKHLIAHSMQQARAQGPEGILFDLKLFSRDWLSHCDKKKLAKIPTIYFHGKEDHILDFEMSAWMQKQNPNSQLKFFSSHGHYSLAIEAADEILSELKTSRAP